MVHYVTEQGHSGQRQDKVRIPDSVKQGTRGTASTVKNSLNFGQSRYVPGPSDKWQEGKWFTRGARGATQWRWLCGMQYMYSTRLSMRPRDNLE